MVLLSFRFALHICHSLQVLLQADEESTREYITEELGLHHRVKGKRLIDIFGDLLPSTISCEPYKNNCTVLLCHQQRKRLLRVVKARSIDLVEE